jgi:molybdopterin-guanine dinucleotide biosynthesis protein B
LLHEIDGPEPDLPTLLAKLDTVDLVLVEGYKMHPFPKLEVHRPSLAKPPIWTNMAEIMAVASDAKIEVGARTLLPLNEPGIVANWVMESISRFRANSP